MRCLPRLLESTVVTALKQFPAVVLTGPRRAEKTSLLRHVARWRRESARSISAG